MSNSLNGKYNPSVHALRRLNERLGIQSEHAKGFVNNCMKSAEYITTQTDGKAVYKPKDKDFFLVVDTNKNVIVTVFSELWTDEGKPKKASTKITVKRISEAILREFNKMKRQINRDVNKLIEQQATLSIQVAELALNKARCKAPHTKELIQSRIDAISTQVKVLDSEIKRKLTEINVAEKEVSAILSK